MPTPMRVMAVTQGHPDQRMVTGAAVAAHSLMGLLRTRTVQAVLQRLEQQSDFEPSRSEGGISAIGHGPRIFLMVPRWNRLIKMRLEIRKGFWRRHSLGK
jgi:hypothetical protein